MKGNKLYKFMAMSGLPWFLFAFLAGIGFKYWYCLDYKKITFRIEKFEDVSLVFLAAMLVWIYVGMKNAMHLTNHRQVGLFTWLEAVRYEPLATSERKHKAQHPPIDEEWLSDKPDGLVLGKQGSKYVRAPLRPGNIQNAIIMGAPGCGKSVLLLTTLIHQLNCNQDDPMTFFAIDIKPELARKSTYIQGNPKVKVMNPTDRSTYGWDPYYNLSANSSDDEIMAELDTIARALIDAGKNEKNEFFYESARAIQKGVLFWTYKQGRSFMQGLNYIMENDMPTIISEVLEKTEGKPEYMRVVKLLKPYAGKDGEAFQGIELAFRQSLSCFSSNTVQFFLGGNPRTASPLDLEEKISVFFSIPETQIDEYKCLLRLVTMQIIQHCSGRPEASHMLTLVIDEAARLGAINWTSFLSTSRSRQCATILAFQSLSQMQTCWSKEEAKSLIELCRIIAVLSCTDTDTANMLSGWAGTYKEEKQSHNEGSAKNKGTYSRTFEDKKLLEPADIMTLQETNEVLLFLKGKYYRTDVAGARYFNIEQLNDISRECVAANTITQEV